MEQYKFSHKVSGRWDRTVVYTCKLELTGSKKSFYSNAEVTTTKDNLGTLKILENSLTGFVESYLLPDIFKAIKDAMLIKYIN